MRESKESQFQLSQESHRYPGMSQTQDQKMACLVWIKVGTAIFQEQMLSKWAKMNLYKWREKGTSCVQKQF